jgi:signal transduction histidine kinase
MLVSVETNWVDATDYRQVFEALPSPVALISIANGEPWLASVSEGFSEQLGVHKAALECRRVADVLRCGPAEAVCQAIADCLKSGGPVRTTITQACCDRVVRMDVEARPLGAGALLTIKALPPRPTLAEVGEIAVLDEMAPLLGGLVFIHDLAKRRIRYGRHPLVEKLNLPLETLEPESVRDRVHPDDWQAFQRHVRAQLRLSDKAVADAFLRFRSADGDWVWLALRARVLDRDEKGAVRRIIGVARDVTRDRETTQALAASALALAHAELNERRRVGRELHDSTSQLLVVASLGLSALERRIELTGEPRRIVNGVRRSIAGAQREIRNFSYMLHPPELQEDGLRKALGTFSAGFGRRTGLDVSVSIEDSPWSLSEVAEMAFFRVAQEALMNVYRHAKARHASVRLRREGSSAVLEIQDDGVGLNHPRFSRKPIAMGVGVSGMKARMAQLGGSLTLESGGTGLTVRACAPLAGQEDRPRDEGPILGLSTHNHVAELLR